MTINNTYAITIKNHLADLNSVVELIDMIANEWSISNKIKNHLNLIAEEAVSNIVFYAFPDENAHDITIKITRKNDLVIIKITDFGIPFNMLEHNKVDVSLPIEERSIGGLGIHILKNLSNDLDYKREDNQNIITITKKI